MTRGIDAAASSGSEESLLGGSVFHRVDNLSGDEQSGAENTIRWGNILTGAVQPTQDEQDVLNLI